MYSCFLLKVSDGEISDFEQCLCTLEFLDKIRPLMKILKEKTPTTRRGTCVATNCYVLACNRLNETNLFLLSLLKF